MTKMLLIDDDPAWRALYRMGFEGDFEVFEAVDGLDALAALDRVRPDVIVLDLRMPHLDGMASPAVTMPNPPPSRTAAARSGPPTPPAMAASCTG